MPTKSMSSMNFQPQEQDSTKHASTFSLRMLNFSSGGDERGFQNDMLHCESKQGRRSDEKVCGVFVIDPANLRLEDRKPVY